MQREKDRKMTPLEKIACLFVIFFILTVVFSWVGDDEIAYKILERKPTSKEGMARIRFVLVKMFAAVLGGGILAVFLGQVILQRTFLFALTKNQIVLLILI